MSKVLVTGATGFVGRNLIPQLRAKGHEVVEVGRDQGDVSSAATWSLLPAADVVVHLAAKTFVPDSWNNPLEFVRCNLLGTLSALEHCRKHRARMVFLSSYLYGNPRSLPISESAKLVVNNPYALSKKMAEEACCFYANNFSVQVAILRPFNIYGSGQPSNFLVPHIIQQALAGVEIRVKDLAPKRDYVHVSDVAEAILKCFELSTPVSILNIGTGSSHSVAELIQLIQESLGTRLPVFSSGESRQGEIFDTVADVRQAEAVLSWKPRYGLREGLAHLVESAKNSRPSPWRDTSGLNA